MPTPVIILAKQRSGTNLLRELLTSSNLFQSFGEVFRPLEMAKEHNFWNFKKKLIKKDQSLLLPSPKNQREIFRKYLIHLNNVADQSKKFFLIDIKYNAVSNFNPYYQNLLDAPFLLDLIKARNIPIIHLIRKKVVETYCSELIAKKTKVWTTREDNMSYKEKVLINSNDLITDIKHRIEEITLFDKYLDDYDEKILLEYSELIDENTNLSPLVKSKISKLLNLNNYLNSSPGELKKIAPPLPNLIENFDDIVASLKEANLSSYL